MKNTSFLVTLRERVTKTKDGGRRLMKNTEIMFVVVVAALRQV